MAFSPLFRQAFLVVFFSLSGLASRAQLDNSALRQTFEVKPEYDQDLRLGLHTFGFSKNNEYFNRIADGYTLFGYHLNPRLTYFASPEVRIEAGVFLWQDFGRPGFTRVQPTFTVKLERERYALLFGNLEGNVNHGYIEPLYDLERVITNRLEHGLQFLKKGKGFTFDAWIDWSRAIVAADPFLEEVVGGFSGDVRLLDTDEGWHLGLPLQFTAGHKGGQIDASDEPLVTVVNSAVGLQVEKKFGSPIWRALRFEPYLVGFRDLSPQKQQPFAQGNGVYLNLALDTKYQNVMVSYWRGRHFLAERGGRLFQSASTTYKNPGYLEPNRELIIVRFLHDIELLDNLTLTLRLEPVFDFNNPKLEFANSFYLTFDQDFFLRKVKW